MSGTHRIEITFVAETGDAEWLYQTLRDEVRVLIDDAFVVTDIGMTPVVTGTNLKPV